MSEALNTIRKLIEQHPTRVWSLAALSEEGGLSLTDAKVAAEHLVALGVLVRKGGDHYGRPLSGDGTKEPLAAD